MMLAHSFIMANEAQVSEKLTNWEWLNQVRLNPRSSLVNKIFGNPLKDYYLQIRTYDEPIEIKPITPKERSKMHFSAMGPMETSTYDGAFSLVTDQCEPEYLFDAKFRNGNFVYGGYFAGNGVPNVVNLAGDFYNPNDFINGIKKQFKITGRQFVELFDSAPRDKREAVRSLLETLV